MKIQVTAQDIENGKRSSCYNCPIALAIRRRPRIEGCCVGPWSCMINNKTYTLPEVAKDFVQKFDLKMTVEPFEFEIT